MFKFRTEYENKNIINVGVIDMFDCIKETRTQKDIVFVCIGTDRAIFDSLGPLVGSQLNNIIKTNNYTNIYSYGDMDSPIHALNIKQSLRKIFNKHNKDNTIFIAIDACAANSIKQLKKVIIAQRPVKPGSGLDKQLGEIGDFSILATTCLYGFDDKHTCNLDEVANMSINIVVAIKKGLEYFIEHEREVYLHES